jgi:signal transduction histidine kinase
MDLKKITCLFLSAFFGLCKTLFAQESVAPAKVSSSEVYCQLAKQTMDNSPDKALQYARKGLELSNASSIAEANAFMLMGTAFKRLGKLDSAFYYYNACYKKRKQHQDPPSQIAEALNGMGIIYSQKGSMDSALAYFIRVQKINEDAHDSAGIAKSLNNIANVYYSVFDMGNALSYYERSLAIKEKLGDEEGINTNRMNLAAIYIDMKQYDVAEKLLNKALASTLTLNKRPDLAYIYNRLSFLYFQKDDYKKSLEFSEKALVINREMKDEFQITGSLIEMAYSYTELGDYKTSAKYAKEGLVYALKENALPEVLELEEILANNALMSKDYKSAYWLLREHEKYYDKYINQNTHNKIAELQQKFEVTEKEKKLNELSLDKKNKEVELYRKKNQVNYLLIAAAAIILCLSFIYYKRTVKQKNIALKQEKELNEQKLSAAEEKRLLQEKQQTELLNVIITAQEEERKKIAVDIHDGLGQLLSGIKMKLQSAINETGISEKEGNLLKTLLELNNESITESKNIAANLLPYNIKDFGLVAAIKNLCYKNNELNISKITFYSNDVPRKIPAEIEITLYRITQELINNALKHAKAGEIFVQLFFRENKLILQVEDNGVGYDTQEISSKENSMGLKNIAIRVKILEGHLDVDSVKGQGTTTLVEFRI